MDLTDCRIRVSDSSDGAPSDQSDAAFTVTAHPGPQPDGDLDGISDDWEYSNLGSIANADETTDADGDRFDDRAECAAGTDPNDPDSLLRIAGLTVETGANLLLKWGSVAYKSYCLGESTNLSAACWATVLSNLTGTPPLNTVTVQQAPP